MLAIALTRALAEVCFVCELSICVDLWWVSQMFDKDGSGTIDEDEFVWVLVRATVCVHAYLCLCVSLILYVFPVWHGPKACAKGPGQPQAWHAGDISALRPLPEQGEAC